MRTRTARSIGDRRGAPASALPPDPLLGLPPNESGPALPPAHSFDGPRSAAARRGGRDLSGPGDRRADGDHRQGPARGAVGVVAPVGGREPALLQLVRPARPEGPQRLPHVRPPHGRAGALTRLEPMRRSPRTALIALLL